MKTNLLKNQVGIFALALVMCTGLTVSTNLIAGNAAQGKGPDNTRSLMTRSAQLEHKIQKRQQSAGNGQKKDSKQYRQGYEDGYNKAVLDLVKAKLLDKDPSATSDKLAKTTKAAPSAGTRADAGNPPLIEESIGGLLVGRWDEAINAASAAIMEDPGHIASYINRSWGYAEKGLTELAIADASQAIRINSKNPLGYNNRAYANELAGHVIKARADYQQACNLNYNPACETSLKMASVAAAEISVSVDKLLAENTQKFMQQDWPAVKTLMTRVLKLDPANSVAFTNRSVAFSQLGKLPQALDDSNQALAINPAFGIGHNNRAHVYELLGNRAMAMEDYGSACKLGIAQSCTDYKRLGDEGLMR